MLDTVLLMHQLLRARDGNYRPKRWEEVQRVLAAGQDPSLILFNAIWGMVPLNESCVVQEPKAYGEFERSEQLIAFVPDGENCYSTYVQLASPGPDGKKVVWMSRAISRDGAIAPAPPPVATDRGVAYGLSDRGRKLWQLLRLALATAANESLRNSLRIALPSIERLPQELRADVELAADRMCDAFEPPSQDEVDAGLCALRSDSESPDSALAELLWDELTKDPCCMNLLHVGSPTAAATEPRALRAPLAALMPLEASAAAAGDVVAVIFKTADGKDVTNVITTSIKAWRATVRHQASFLACGSSHECLSFTAPDSTEGGLDFGIPKETLVLRQSKVVDPTAALADVARAVYGMQGGREVTMPLVCAARVGAQQISEVYERGETLLRLLTCAPSPDLLCALADGVLALAERCGKACFMSTDLKGEHFVYRYRMPRDVTRSVRFDVTLSKAFLSEEGKKAKGLLVCPDSARLIDVERAHVFLEDQIDSKQSVELATLSLLAWWCWVHGRASISRTGSLNAAPVLPCALRLLDRLNMVGMRLGANPPSLSADCAKDLAQRLQHYYFASAVKSSVALPHLPHCLNPSMGHLGAVLSWPFEPRAGFAELLATFAEVADVMRREGVGWGRVQLLGGDQTREIARLFHCLATMGKNELRLRNVPPARGLSESLQTPLKAACARVGVSVPEGGDVDGLNLADFTQLAKAGGVAAFASYPMLHAVAEDTSGRIWETFGKDKERNVSYAAARHRLCVTNHAKLWLKLFDCAFPPLPTPASIHSRDKSRTAELVCAQLAFVQFCRGSLKRVFVSRLQPLTLGELKEALEFDETDQLRWLSEPLHAGSMTEEGLLEDDAKSCLRTGMGFLVQVRTKREPKSQQLPDSFQDVSPQIDSGKSGAKKDSGKSGTKKDSGKSGAKSSTLKNEFYVLSKPAGQNMSWHVDTDKKTSHPYVAYMLLGPSPARSLIHTFVNRSNPCGALPDCFATLSDKARVRSCRALFVSGDDAERNAVAKDVLRVNDEDVSHLEGKAVFDAIRQAHRPVRLEMKIPVEVLLAYARAERVLEQERNEEDEKEQSTRELLKQARKTMLILDDVEADTETDVDPQELGILREAVQRALGYKRMEQLEETRHLAVLAGRGDMVLFRGDRLHGVENLVTSEDGGEQWEVRPDKEDLTRMLGPWCLVQAKQAPELSAAGPANLDLTLEIARTAPTTDGPVHSAATYRAHVRLATGAHLNTGASLDDVAPLWRLVVDEKQTRDVLEKKGRVVCKLQTLRCMVRRVAPQMVLAINAYPDMR